MLFIKKRFLLLLIFILLLFNISCLTTYQIPKEYVPDDKIVYLKQKIEFEPIRYDGVETYPYEWVFKGSVDEKNPSFLKNMNFDYYFTPDFYGDAKTYLEVSSHLKWMLTEEVFVDLKKKLDQFSQKAPEPMKVVKGDVVKTFTNATEYVYPSVEGATITIFQSGDIRINFPDGSMYYKESNGNYYERDGKDDEKYAVSPLKESFRISIDGIKYYMATNHKYIETSKAKVELIYEDPMQYQYKPADKKYSYIFFINESENGYSELSVTIPDVIRIDFFPDKDDVMIVKENDALIINKEFEKQHYYFNRGTRMTEHLLSFFLPEGIRISGMEKQLTYGFVKSNWPENYLSKTIGGFTFLYTKKDEKLLIKLSSSKLQSFAETARKLCGLNAYSDRVIILPPDLESYRKLHASEKPETMYWYPSGFQTLDHIVMWPPSVPRYKATEGEEYFWSTEFYEIFVHEYTHLLVGENSGIVFPVPIWLQEGMALVVESSVSDYTKKYWDVTFDVAYNTKNLLDWEDITLFPTGNFPLSQARVHYAQSYKFVQYLLKKYGVQKINNYLVLFKAKPEDLAKLNLSESYKIHFQAIFSVSFDDCVKDFYKWYESNKYYLNFVGIHQLSSILILFRGQHFLFPTPILI